MKDMQTVKDKQIGIRISLELYNEIRNLSDKEHRSLSNMIRVLLEEGLKRWSEERGKNDPTLQPNWKFACSAGTPPLV